VFFNGLLGKPIRLRFTFNGVVEGVYENTPYRGNPPLKGYRIKIYDRDSRASVYMFFDASMKPKLAELTRNEMITVTGNVSLLSLRGNEMFVKDCDVRPAR